MARRDDAAKAFDTVTIPNQRLRAVFFGEVGSTFSQLHLAVLAGHADVLLWVAGRTQSATSAPRQSFVSALDWWERFTIRARLEWQTWRHLGAPIGLFQSPACPVHLVTRNDLDLIKTLTDLQIDLILSAGFSRILPKEILDIPKLGAFNCHPSPLPRYAGSNPWFWILRNGEAKMAVTIHRMVAEADAGQIVRQSWFDISPQTNHQQLYNESSQQSARLLRECLDSWQQGIFEETFQDQGQRSFFSAPREGDYQIDWTQSARQIQNLVRASSPAPGAWTCARGQRFTVRQVIVEGAKGTSPGMIVSVNREGVRVECADGVVRVCAVVLNEREARGAAMARALGVSAGERFG